MVANPSTLYLQEIPKPYSGKVVQLTSVNISEQDLALILATMTQKLLTDMSKTVQFLSQLMETNAQASQLSVGVAKSEADKAIAAADKELKQEEAQEHPAWWQQVLNVLVKDVLPVLMCIIAGILFGPAAGLIAGAIFLATAVPISDGKSLISLVSSAIAEGLGKDFGWSAGTIQIVQGVLNVVIAAALAVVGGGAASAATAGEAVAESAASEVADTVATTAEETVTTTAEESSTASTAESTSGFKFTNAGRYTAFNAFSSTTANTNSWYDIAYGIWQLKDSDPKDQENNKMYAQIISTAMNILVAAVSIAGTFSAFSQGASAGEALGSNTLQVQKFFTFACHAGLVVAAGSQVNEGIQNKNLEDCMADVTRTTAALKFIEGVDHIASQNSTNVNASLKNALSEYDTMLGNNPNYASVEFTEAKELAMCNNRA